MKVTICYPFFFLKPCSIVVIFCSAVRTHERGEFDLKFLTSDVFSDLQARKRGRRGGVRTKVRRRRYRLPLPSILFGNVQSVRPKKNLTGFPVSRPTIILTADPKFLGNKWRKEKKEKRKSKRRSTFCEQTTQGK